MNTRKKNKSRHPGIPDMTPSQLASAGLSRVQNTRRASAKKPTKDQQIATLQDELRAVRELISNVSHFAPHYPYPYHLQSAYFPEPLRQACHTE